MEKRKINKLKKHNTEKKITNTITITETYEMSRMHAASTIPTVPIIKQRATFIVRMTHHASQSIPTTHHHPFSSAPFQVGGGKRVKGNDKKSTEKRKRKRKKYKKRKEGKGKEEKREKGKEGKGKRKKRFWRCTCTSVTNRGGRFTI